jgi:hypothetical protein
MGKILQFPSQAKVERPGGFYAIELAPVILTSLFLLIFTVFISVFTVIYIPLQLLKLVMHTIQYAVSHLRFKCDIEK